MDATVVPADAYMDLLLSINNAAHFKKTSKKCFEYVGWFLNMKTSLSGFDIKVFDMYKKDLEVSIKRYQHEAEYGYRSNNYFASVAKVLEKALKHLETSVTIEEVA